MYIWSIKLLNFQYFLRLLYIQQINISDNNTEDYGVLETKQARFKLFYV